ncbi:hypothetical protein FRB99_008943 [Tulasnella sp. 403]|nr:hypothetical protein FRB99_008943 [Tulasnella sp. 403]
MHPNNPAIDPIGRHQTGAGDNPFDHPDGLATGFLNAVLATALFRCWHLALLFTLWATAISLISDKVRPLTVQPTLLTVFGTSLGFVISYRTSSAFERYNEGRRYWSSILYCSRTLARVIWFHVPDSPADPDHPEQNPARMLIERKSAINLIEAFAVAVKHYLRGEEGIDYPDLYELVCFLPVYSLPAGRPQTVNMDNTTSRGDGTPGPITRSETFRSQFSRGFPGLSSNQSRPKDPQPESQATSNKASVTPVGTIRGDSDIEKGEFPKPKSAPTFSTVRTRTSMVTGRSKVGFYPITLLKRLSVKHAKGEEETRRTREAENHNIPLEITFYLSSYIVELQRRKILDVPTLTNLLLNLNALVDALTGDVLDSPAFPAVVSFQVPHHTSDRFGSA